AGHTDVPGPAPQLFARLRRNRTTTTPRPAACSAVALSGHADAAGTGHNTERALEHSPAVRPGILDAGLVSAGGRRCRNPHPFSACAAAHGGTGMGPFPGSGAGQTAAAEAVAGAVADPPHHAGRPGAGSHHCRAGGTGLESGGNPHPLGPGPAAPGPAPVAGPAAALRLSHADQRHSVLATDSLWRPVPAGIQRF